MLSALGRGGTVGMFHYLAHGMNLVRVVKDNVQLMLWEYHNVLKYGSLRMGHGIGGYLPISLCNFKAEKG